MAQQIKQGNIFGRIGTGLGKGLAEQLPKEVERGRLASGLKQLGEQKGQTPFQQFAGLASIPGTTPQIIQSGSQLLQQQQYLDSIKNQYEGQGGAKTGNKGYVPTQQDFNQPPKGEIPTLGTPEDTAQSYKEFIPPSEQEERTDAYQNFQKNPARYNYDFENALKERKAITSRNQEIQKAHQGQDTTAVAKEADLKQGLREQVDKLGLSKIPPKARQNFEQKILNDMLAKKDGGQGLTREQAIQENSEAMRQANRDYEKLESLSGWSPRDWNRQVNALRTDFGKRDELQLAKDQLTTNYGVSPSYAAHKMYPIGKGEMPTLKNLGIQVGTSAIGGISLPKVNDITYSKLKDEMGKTHSPLSIAYDLEEKGQDGRAWLKYLDDNRKNLEVWQADEISNGLPILNITDIWLRSFEKE